MRFGLDEGEQTPLPERMRPPALLEPVVKRALAQVRAPLVPPVVLVGFDRTLPAEERESRPRPAVRGAQRPDDAATRNGIHRQRGVPDGKPWRADVRPVEAVADRG